MVRPQTADSMERASHMRLHRSQSLQGSACVPLYFFAAGLHGPAAIFLCVGWTDGLAFQTQVELCGMALSRFGPR
jgi:hypothetical protein